MCLITFSCTNDFVILSTMRTGGIRLPYSMMGRMMFFMIDNVESFLLASPLIIGIGMYIFRIVVNFRKNSLTCLWCP